jgi:hypothetical protein
MPHRQLDLPRKALAILQDQVILPRREYAASIVHTHNGRFALVDSPRTGDQIIGKVKVSIEREDTEIRLSFRPYLNGGVTHFDAEARDGASAESILFNWMWTGVVGDRVSTASSDLLLVFSIDSGQTPKAVIRSFPLREDQKARLAEMDERAYVRTLENLRRLTELAMEEGRLGTKPTDILV